MAKNAEETLGSLQKLNAALTANAATFSNIEAERQRFNEMVTATLEAFTRQGALTSEKQESSQILRDLLTETSRLATSLRFSVKSLYGIRSEKLVEFGMKPFRAASRLSPFSPPRPRIRWIPDRPSSNPRFLIAFRLRGVCVRTPPFFV